MPALIRTVARKWSPKAPPSCASASICRKRPSSMGSRARPRRIFESRWFGTARLPCAPAMSNFTSTKLVRKASPSRRWSRCYPLPERKENASAGSSKNKADGCCRSITLTQPITPQLAWSRQNMDEKMVESLETIGRQDHSNSNEYQIFGPPGTGKTTSATRQIHRAADRFGDSSVMVTSFTRAAAIELTGRDVPIDLDRIGTLHSRCFHALGKPPIAEAHVEEWNRDNPRFSITPVSRDRRLEGEDSSTEEDSGIKGGDRLLQQLNYYRGKMLPPE